MTHIIPEMLASWLFPVTSDKQKVASSNPHNTNQLNDNEVDHKCTFTAPIRDLSAID
jgi:hypothetical protein